MAITSPHKLLGPALALGLFAALHLGGTAPLAAQEVSAVADYAAKDDPPVFDTSDAAIEAFKAVLAKDDFDGLAALLGLDAKKLKASDGVMETYAKIREGVAKRIVIEDKHDRVLLDIGDKLWPLPFPIVKGKDGKWAFDTYAGLEEIVNQRIGENELEAIATMRAYVEGQNDYFEEDRDGDGVREYAQKLISGEGRTDGLYWPASLGAGESPAGEFVNQAALDKAARGEGYFGYRFRILTGQGDNIAGGPYSYVINGNMIAGFALIGSPVKYGETGVQTFLVNQHGIVYQADLGPRTEAKAKKITRFDPDKSWTVVKD
jgi:hypothetical protein